MTTDDPTSNPDPVPAHPADARRRLAALAALAELTGGRAATTSLSRGERGWVLELSDPAAGRSVRLWLSGTTGADQARRVLDAGERVVLAEAARRDGGIRIRLAWVGGLCDLGATDWGLADG